MAFILFNPTAAATTVTLRGCHTPVCNNSAKCSAAGRSMENTNVSTMWSNMPSVALLVQQALKTTAGVMLLSTTMVMSPLDGTMTMTALADEQPLVFDHDQTLAGADFANRSDLKGAIFSKANCKGATFNGSDLTNAQLDDANMIGANLEGVTAVNVSATKTKFQKANLKNTDFTNANLISAIFDGADIEGADFSDSLLDKVTTLKLCKVAKGVHPKTGVSTAESLMCPE